MARDDKIVFRTGTGAPNAADVDAGEPCWSGAGSLYLKRSSDGAVVLVGPITSLAWTAITGTPTTLAEYGVTAVSAGIVTGLAAIATSGSASDLASGTVPIARIPTGTASTTVCVGNDSRLSDSRAPTAHKTTHATGGSDALAASDIGAAAASHTHGNITNAGAIGSTSNQIVVTTTSGVLTTATIGSGLSLSGGTLTASGGGGSSGISAYAASKIFR